MRASPYDTFRLETSTMALTTNASESLFSKQRATLLSLPRELRDKIYRYIIKGTYVVVARPESWPDDFWDAEDCPGVEIPNPDLGIFCVSKLVSDEVLALFYSESIFRIYHQFDTDQTFWLCRMGALERVMNIELDVDVSWKIMGTGCLSKLQPYVEYLNCVRMHWNAIISCCDPTNTLRDSLRIRWRICTEDIRIMVPGWPDNDIIAALPQWIYRALRSKTRFRTIILQILASSIAVHDLGENKGIVRKFETESQTIADYLGRTLGPADIDHAYNHANQQYVGTLTFHPHKHIRTILRARAETLGIGAAIEI